MNQLIETLKKLHFKHIPQKDAQEAYLKQYNGFKLFAVVYNNKIIGSITVDNLEISLPLIYNKDWLIEFDKENS